MGKQIDNLAAIQPQRRNANRHTARGLGALDQSIHADGWIGAITVAADGETFDGSARIEVGMATGFDAVEPIVIRSSGDRPIIHIREDIPTADDPRAVRLGLAANRVAQLNLDFDPAILAELADTTDLSQLFYEDELSALLAGVGGEDVEEGDFDGTPATEGPTRTALGDIWSITGNGLEHRLAVGDCTDPAVVERLMGGEKASAVVTDPPYGIDASSMTMGKGQSDKPKHERLSYRQEWDRERPDVRPLLRLAQWVCIWGGNYFADMLPVTSDWLCWWKKNDERSFAEFELAWTNYGSNARHIAHHWGGEEKEHITQKPLAVVVWCIEQCPDASLILDPFLGSGTTLIAGHRLGRNVYGCEINPRYADLSLARAESAGLTCTRVEE